MPENNFIELKIEGDERIKKALEQFPRKVARYMGMAGKEAIKKGVFYEIGLKKYPPATSANQPPTPYYIRGRGMQYKSKNTLSSERLGTRWYVRNENGGFSTVVGNPVSYATYVVGEDQAQRMAAKGWKQLIPTVYKNMDRIKFVYDEWIGILLKDIERFGGA